MTIYISNFATQTTEEHLRGLLDSYGNIQRISLPKERETGQSRKFAYVELAEAQLEETAILELDGKDWNGTCLRVDKARSREQR